MSNWYDAAEWFYSVDGSSSGPVTVDELRRLIGDGTVRPEHFVRHTGWDRWWTVHDAAATLEVDLAAVQPTPAPTGPPPSDAAQPQPGTPSESAANGAPSLATDVTFVQRAVSWAIDGLVLVVAMLLFNAIFSGQPAIATLLLAAGYGGYTFALRYYGHDTLGHLVMRLRVRDAETGGAPDWTALAIRSALLALLAAPLMLGVIGAVVAAFVHPSIRAWHDIASGTVVVGVGKAT